MNKEKDKELVSKLLKASNEIHKKRLGQANYIHVPAKFIQQLADEEGVTFDEMLDRLQNCINQNKDD